MDSTFLQESRTRIEQDEQVRILSSIIVYSCQSMLVHFVLESPNEQFAKDAEYVQLTYNDTRPILFTHYRQVRQLLDIQS